MSVARAPQGAVIIGAGLMGLSLARRLAAAGWAVTVIERGVPGGEASTAAAGMLIPTLEFEPGSEALQLGLAARAHYPGHAAELQAETGQSVDLRLDGALALPETDGESWTPPGGQPVTGAELRRLEPELAESVDRAWYVAGEGSVDPRGLVAATLASCRNRGVAIRAGVTALEVLLRGDRVAGARTDAGDIEAEVVVNAAGAWASAVRVPGCELRVRPVKGQMLLLDAGAAPRRPLEHVVYSHLAYLVPRSDGRVIVGTTAEERGFDKTVEAWALARLAGNAALLCPRLGQARFVEAWAGLRPLGEGKLPSIGPRGPPGHFTATGHYRNGILLCPYTAEILAGMICGHPTGFTPTWP
jgi:glycine oxidase